MRRIPREPAKFETLDLFTAMGRARGYKVGEPASIAEFGEAVRASLEAAHRDRKILFGKRVEAMFAHVAGALGACRIIKSEDAGEIFVDGDDVRAPDYRLTLKDGSQMLVEVKNFHFASLEKRFRIRAKYYEQLERYASLNAVPLKFAVFFSAMNRWCLLSKRAFDLRDGYFETTIPSAFAKSEMITLGDCALATEPTLVLELMSDRVEASKVEDDGTAQVIFRRSKMLCAGRELTSPLDQKIAFHFMRYGDWVDRSEAVIEDGRVLGIRITAQPREERVDDQPFAMVGQFSSMVSTAYSEYTVVESKPIALDAPVDPDVFSLSIPEDFKSDALPLRRFRIQPNWEFV